MPDLTFHIRRDELSSWTLEDPSCDSYCALAGIERPRRHPRGTSLSVGRGWHEVLVGSDVRKRVFLREEIPSRPNRRDDSLREGLR